MLLNRALKIISVIGLSFFVISCGDKNDDALRRIDFENKIQLIELSTKVLGNEVVSAFGGFFDESPRKKIAVIVETDENVDWGIKFILLEEVEGALEKSYESRILAGSHKESFLDKIKFPSFDYELLYYNSQDYFMGTGGGEIFSYVIDFENKEVYYSHLISEPRKAPSLFISKNVDRKEIKNFFTQIFKKDYPSLKLIDQDITLE